MAQFGSRTRAGEPQLSKRFAARLGFGSKRVLVAVASALVLLAVCAGVAVVAPSFRGGLTIERVDGAEEPAQDQASESASAVEAAESGGLDGAQPAQSAEPMRVVVHVDGAVTNPGVYVVAAPDPRVNDAVVLAGGLAKDADTAGVNLAAPLSDGMKVHIPAQGEEPAATVLANTGDGQGAANETTGDAASTASSGLVNLNTASVSELEALPGIGPVLAQAIVDERANGPFASVDDLARVAGIGAKKIEKLRNNACV